MANFSDVGVTELHPGTHLCQQSTKYQSQVPNHTQIRNIWHITSKTVWILNLLSLRIMFMFNHNSTKSCSNEPANLLPRKQSRRATCCSNYNITTTTTAYISSFSVTCSLWRTYHIFDGASASIAYLSFTINLPFSFLPSADINKERHAVVDMVAVRRSELHRTKHRSTTEQQVIYANQVSNKSFC